jgi:hypothetical protein
LDHIVEAKKSSVHLDSQIHPLNQRVQVVGLHQNLEARHRAEPQMTVRGLRSEGNPPRELTGQVEVGQTDGVLLLRSL